MQRFLGLLQCDAQPPSSSAPLKTIRPLSPDDPEGDDDLRSEFACPFCYEEFDIGSLCSHIDAQHCFESQSAVCPVCAAKVGEDVVAHMTLQHGHFFKRRRRLVKANASSSSTLCSIAAASEEACATSSTSMDHQQNTRIEGTSLGCNSWLIKEALIY